VTDIASIREHLQRNLLVVQQRIADASRRSGRVATDITLVAVTKYVEAAVARSLIECGQRALGESRPQELWTKAAQIADDSVQWHLIGHLQRNKVKRTIPFCTLIHSIDSLRLLEAVAAAATESNRTVDCLLEVNVSGESAKHGFAGSELGAVLTAAADWNSLRIKGLMTMASLSGDDNRHRREFAKLRELRDQHAHFTGENVELVELSMGMSGDFEAAIEEGATIVRVGSALFEGLIDNG